MTNTAAKTQPSNTDLAIMWIADNEDLEFENVHNLLFTPQTGRRLALKKLIASKFLVKFAELNAA